MTFKHKISRRLALIRGLSLLALGTAACSDEQSIAGPGGEGTISSSTANLLSTTTRIGDRVEATTKAYIRSTASGTGTLLGTQPRRARGTIVAGPITDVAGDGLIRYQVDFDSGVDGWGAAEYFNNVGTSPVATITVAPAPARVAPGATMPLVATLRDAQGHVLEGRTIAWSSTDTALATVGTDGVLRGRAVGTTTVRATAEGRTGIDTVTVVSAPLSIGARISTTATAYIRAGSSVSTTLVGTQPVGAVGTVLEGPVTDAAGDGLTRWRVDFDSGVDGWAAAPYIVAYDAPAAQPPATVTTITVTPKTISLVSGGTATITAIATDASGANVSGATITWTSRDTTRVRVSGTGVVSALAVGSAWVVATSGAPRDSSSVTVTAVPVASVAVTPTTANLAVNGTVTLSATTRDAAGAVLTGRTITWTSSATAVATVSATGVVTGRAAGSATITATSEGRTATSVITVTSGPVVRVGKYVAPNGSSANAGTITSPWDLRTALSGAGGRIVAGDTVWVRGGTYTGPFTSTLTGTSSRPIVVRAYPGERATIAHSGTGLTTLGVSGQWSVFWGLEVMNPNTTRVTSSTESEQRANGVVNNASNTKYVNMIVHDAGVGFYNYTNYTNVEVYGSIFYNNGWQGPDRGHGHAMYIKSDNGPVLLKDNVMFNQFGYGVHVYTNAGSGHLNNIRVEGNTSFNSGTLSNNSNSENILLGGADYSTGSSVVNNNTYFSAGLGGRNVRVGYGTLLNGTVSVTGNQMVGGNPVLDFGFWTSATLSGNTLVGTGQMLRQNNLSVLGLTWGTNRHHRDPNSTAWYASGSWRTFSTWRTLTGLGGSDVVSGTAPSGTQVIVRANAYEAGRATVTVYDWTRAGAVNVSLSGVLNAGDRYEVRDVQAPFGAPLVSGTYAGSISVPMGAVAPPAPIGGSASAPPRLGTDFGAFIVTRVP